MIKYHEDKGLKVNSAQSTKKFDFLKNVSSNNSTKIKNVNLEGMHWMEKGPVSTSPSDILQVLDYLFLKSTITFFSGVCLQCIITLVQFLSLEVSVTSCDKLHKAAYYFHLLCKSLGVQ